MTEQTWVLIYLFCCIFIFFIGIVAFALCRMSAISDRKMEKLIIEERLRRITDENNCN
jgi:hypothetical protein